MAKSVLYWELLKVNRLMDQGLIQRRDYDKAVVSLLDGLLALLL